MIYLGLDNAAKDARVREYSQAHKIEKIVILSPAKFRFLRLDTKEQRQIKAGALGKNAGIKGGRPSKKKKPHKS